MSANTPKSINPEKLHLVGIKLNKASFDIAPELSYTEIGSIDFSVETRSGFNFQENYANITLSFALYGSNEDKERLPVEAFFELSFDFLVENIYDYVIEEGKDGEEEKVDVSLGITLTAIAYSTARGVLMTRFQGTAFKDFILPIADPAKILLGN